AVGRVESVGLAVVHGDPIGIELGRSVRATRIKRRALGLRNFLHFAVKLGGRRLIETHAFTEAENTHALQQPQRTQRVGIGGVFWRLEADLDVTLRREIVDLRRLHFLDDTNEIGGVGQIAVVHEEARAWQMRVDIQMIDTLGIERRRTPLDAVDLVALLEQEFCEIAAVLTRNAGNECTFCHRAKSRLPETIRCSPVPTAADTNRKSRECRLPTTCWGASPLR